MKRVMKKIVVSYIAMLIISSLVGCGSQGAGTKKENGSKNNAKEQGIEIKDIEWNVDEGIVDGERYVVLNYTNNSKYDICGFGMTFSEKSGLTDEQKEEFYKEIQSKYSFSDEDIASLKEKNISASANSDKTVKVGESAKNINLHYYSGITYLRDMKHFELTEPDIATIKYIDNDKIIIEYYDFKTDKYTFEEKEGTASQWGESQLASKVPKPDVDVIEVSRDDETCFMFDASGYSLDQFNEYVDECKGLGYTVDEKSFEGFYQADSEEGYNVYLAYEESSGSLSGIVTPSEK